MSDDTKALLDSIRVLAEVHAGKGILARIYEKPDKVHNDTRDVLLASADLIESLQARLDLAERAIERRDAVIDARPHSPRCDSTYEGPFTNDWPPCNCGKAEYDAAKEASHE